MSRTRILLFLLVLVICMQIFPEHARLIQAIAVGAGALYCLAWGIVYYRAHHLRAAATASQTVGDAAEYQRYKSELDSIRAKHDPLREANESFGISDEYRAELSALHDKYREMLERKFGKR